MQSIVELAVVIVAVSFCAALGVCAIALMVSTLSQAVISLRKQKVAPARLDN